MCGTDPHRMHQWKNWFSGFQMTMHQRRMRPGSKVNECISIEKITGSNIITIECISGYKALVQIVCGGKKSENASVRKLVQTTSS
jgi:hypothetical protein